MDAAGRVCCLTLGLRRRAQALGQASRSPGRVRHQFGLGNERFPSLKCVCQASFFVFFPFFFLFCFVCLFHIFSWGRGRNRVVRVKTDAALLVGLWFVTWTNVRLIRETRPGYTPDVPSWSAVLEGLPAWPVMTLMTFFTLCVPSHCTFLLFHL